MTRPRFCPQCGQGLTTLTLDNTPRVACADAACGYVHWDNPVPVVAAVVEHDGQIVLARNAQWPPEMFALITGFLEREDPDPASGVLREVEEELGLQGEIAGFIGHYTFPRMNQLIIAYHVRARGKVRLDAELAEYRHVSFDALRPWPGATGDALRDWMLARGLTPLPYDHAPLRAIRDFRRIDRELAIAGQPVPLQFKALRFADYRAVINLAPPDAPDALADEAQQARGVGLRYHAIPVAWTAPTDEDFDRFRAVMRAEAGQRLVVHCIAAKRASAFVYLHRVIDRGDDAASAAGDLLATWMPDPVWQTFIDRQLQRAGVTVPPLTPT